MSRYLLFVRAWFMFASVLFVLGCGDRPSDSRLETTPPTPPMEPLATSNALRLDPNTGIPYAITFQHPIPGLDASDYGFGFGSENRWFCLSSTNGQCSSYGYHLGRDTLVAETAAGTDVFAPADGIVRVTTDLTFGGYGADASRNPNYNGCVIVLEHLLANGDAVTTLLGHLRCDQTTPYNADTRKGNPPRGEIVRRGQYVGHVGHYWHGADSSADWHHVHWAMRKGRFTAANNVKADVLPYVLGYAPYSEFTRDPASGALVHATWLDPFLVVAANGDPVLQANANVRHHPSGSLLLDSDGGYWYVNGEAQIASVPWDVIVSDRFDIAGAVPASDDEMRCYSRDVPLMSQGYVTLYQRPGTQTVVMAYDASWTRYDVIRLEALLSWGYKLSEVGAQASASFFEGSYASQGFRLLRPGTLVKAYEESEVSMVTVDQKRLPIASADVFEQAGFQWHRIISLPKVVLDQVAGTRSSNTFTLEMLHACAVPAPCPNGATSCGGGGTEPVCVPGKSIHCVCTDGASGAQLCADDGSGYLPCVCLSDPIPIPTPDPIPSSEPEPLPAPVPVPLPDPPITIPPYEPPPVDPPSQGGSGGIFSGGTWSNPPTSGGAGTVGSGGAPATSPPITGSGGAPSGAPLHLSYTSPVSGPLSIQGWWQPPGGANVSWHLITECVDVNTSDNVLDCDLPVPSGTSRFEFQIYLPNNRYWGDHACDSGGCNQPLGVLTLTMGSVPVSYSFEPNGSGAPYYNGRVAPVP